MPQVKDIVCKGDQRKYYRFRATRFYSGCSTADCCGCNIRCAYCYSAKPRDNPEKYGKFYSPEEVANKLISIARNKGYNQIRISGNEPTLCKEHLLQVISKIPKDILFVLETNGIELGQDEDFVKQLSKFKNLYVRVSVKGSNPQHFAKITAAKPELFKYQLRALEFLVKHRIECRAAIMYDVFTDAQIKETKQKLAKISLSLAEIELESLILYPFVKAAIQKRKIWHR